MDQQDPSRLAFGDVAIDLAGRRVWRADAEQPLEPKAFGVLALLATAPGRVHTRDEILDAVWGHRHVTPGVLNRVMTLLRHALGEDAQHPRYLHTVHGVGYRFDLPPAPSAGDVDPGIDADASDASTVAGPAAPLPRRRAGDRRGPRLAQRALPWLAVLAVALAVAGWRLWPRPAGRLLAPAPAATASPSLVVLPLRPIGRGEDAGVVADGLGEDLIGALARIQGLRVIARESTRIAAAESTDPGALARRLGITHVLEGSLQQSGQRLRVHLRLVDAGDGDAVWTRDFDRDASEVLGLQREIAESVAASLTLKLGLPAAPGRSGDAQFLRRFMAAQKRLFDATLPDKERMDPAEAEFRALLRERPDDGRVHAALAILMTFRTTLNPALPESARENALQEALVAQRLDPSLAEPYFVRAFFACQRNQWEACLSLMQAADSRGMKAPPIANQAMAYARLGYLDRAEALAREQVARDPLNPAAHFTLARLLDTRGRHRAALEHFAPSRRRRDSVGHYGHWFNAYWRRDYAEAGALVNEGLAPLDPAWPKLRPAYEATMRALTAGGDWADAAAENRRFEQATGLFALLRLVQPDAPAHAAALVDGLERMRKGGYSTWDLVLWNPEYAFLRRDPAFQDYLRRNGLLDYWRRHGFPPQCRPEGPGARCA